MAMKPVVHANRILWNAVPETPVTLIIIWQLVMKEPRNLIVLFNET